MKKPAILFLIFGVLTISSILITPVQGHSPETANKMVLYSAKLILQPRLAYSVLQKTADARLWGALINDRAIVGFFAFQKKREGSTWAWGYDDADSQTRYFGSKSFNIPCCHFDWEQMESGLRNQIESEIFSEKHWQTRAYSSRKLPKRRRATLTIIGRSFSGELGWIYNGVTERNIEDGL
ncbi:hypothetical protein D5086_002358 [Populus alba]|uniref:Uncharacterized protein n=1 Tax=Populus alba TaxID=43335 RepID=A0ACC4D1S5_POPAL